MSEDYKQPGINPPSPEQNGDQPSTAPDAGKDAEQALASYAYNRWKQQSDHYTGYYRLWTRCILFLLGKQWLTWNKTQRTWAPEKNVPKWRQQPVTNLTFAVYRTAISKLTKQRPAFDCVPPSGDSDDREAAQLGGSLLQYWWRQLRMSTTLNRSIGWLLATGNVYFMVYWDATAGEIVPLKTAVDTDEGTVEDVPADKEGDPHLTADGKPDMNAEPHKIAQGEIGVTLVSPMSVRFNPDAETPEDAREWLIGEIVPASIAAEMFGIQESEIGGSGDEELSTSIDMITAASTGTSSSYGMWTGSDNSQAKGKRCLVLRYYSKPEPKYPKGRHFICVDQKMVQKESELPYGFWPPLVAVQDVPVPGQAIAMGLLGQIVPLNEQYNTLNAKIMEHNVTMAMGGKWILSPEDQNLPIDSDPAQKLVSKGYAAGRPPTQTKPVGLPAEVYRERERVMQDFQMVSAMGEIGLSKKPEGVTSGRGFLVLQEAVDSVLTPTLMSMETGLEEIGRRCLVICQKYYREERTIKIRGENGQWEFRSFMGSDIVEGMDVQVQVGSSFPWSKSARQDASLQLLQAFPGLVTNPDGSVNGQKLAKYTNVGGIEAFQSENDPDSDEIDHEHAQFEVYGEAEEEKEGGIPQIAFWQNHVAHFAGHADFMKRDRARFNRWSPQAQQAFLKHITDTQAAITEGMQQMMPQGAPGQPGNTDGAPGGPPGAPGGPPGAPDAPPQLSVMQGGQSGGQAGLTRSDFQAAGQ